MDKVYQNLLEIMREEGKSYNDERLSIGIVRSVKPLQVAYGDMVFDRNELKVAEHLLEQTLDVELLDINEQISIVRDVENRELWSTDIVKKIKLPSVLEAGNKLVVILRGDILWVLCKVV